MGDVRPCKYWERCFEGRINRGSCADGQLFSEVLRECVPAGDPTIPNSCYPDWLYNDPCYLNGNPYTATGELEPYCGEGYECVNPTNCIGWNVIDGGNCLIECVPLTPPPSDECNAGCILEAECAPEKQCPEVQTDLDFHTK